MTDSHDACGLCGGGQREKENPLVPDAFYPDTQLHLHCLNSPEGHAWTRRQADADPAYARFLAMTTVGLPVVCANCGTTHRLSPKTRGMSAGHWELNCTACHRFRTLINAYRSATERDFHLRLALLQKRFTRGHDVPAVLRDVETISAQIDLTLALTPCECGAPFSAAAHPRCHHCVTELIASPFHIAPSSSETRSAPAAT